MRYRLIRDLNSRQYKVGDEIPAELAHRLIERHRLKLNEFSFVEEIRENDEVAEAHIQEEVEDAESRVEEEPFDVNKDGKVDLKDAVEVVRKVISPKKKKKGKR